MNSDSSLTETSITRYPEVEERFLRYVYPDPNSGCWLWGGATTGGDYGCFGWPRFSRGRNRQVKAHHASLILFRGGPPPPGAHVMHKCDTPCCVNPDHLVIADNSANRRDMAVKSRGRKSAAGLPRGVRRRFNRFQARFGIKGLEVNLGTFATPEEAGAAALAARQNYWRTGCIPRKA